jgi:hypothetical protein
MTNAYFGCHSERKRGIFLDVKTHGGLKMNHYQTPKRANGLTRQRSSVKWLRAENKHGCVKGNRYVKE